MDQLDLFGAAVASPVEQASLPMMEPGGQWGVTDSDRFRDLVRRGDVAQAADMLGELRMQDAERVLLESGFSVGRWKSRAEMFNRVQGDLLAAARAGVDGLGLRKMRESGVPSQEVVFGSLYTGYLDHLNAAISDGSLFSQKRGMIEVIRMDERLSDAESDAINKVIADAERRLVPPVLTTQVPTVPMIQAGVWVAPDSVGNIDKVASHSQSDYDADVSSGLVATSVNENKDVDHGGNRVIVSSGVVPDRDGREYREDGRVGNVGGKPLVVGLAGSGHGAVESESVHGQVARTGRAGSGSVVGGGGNDSLGEARDSEDVRGAGSAAGDLTSPVTLADDHVLEADDIGSGGLGEKYRDNIRAIQITKALVAEGRHATVDERKSLARYVGWGGLKGVFDPDNRQWGARHLALKALLTDDEFAAARRSQLDAHYTSPVVVKAMFDGLERMGFKKGRILEPSVGVGNFFGLMPSAMHNDSTLHGCELDVLTSQIAAALYPSAKIAQATGFQDYAVPAGYFDVVVGNPPFGSQAIMDDKGSVYSGWSIHNYFFAKSVEMMRPGGVMSMVVSHSFLDKLDPHVRQWISRRAELVSGIRLPNTAFKENANTEVVTDILVFRRLDERDTLSNDDKAADWLNASEVSLENGKTGEVGTAMVNDYFVKNPQNVLGTPSLSGNLYRGNSYTVEPNGNLDEQLAEWVKSLPEGVYQPLERSVVALELSAVAVPEGVKEGCFFVAGQQVFRRLPDAFGETRAAAWEPPNAKANERMLAMIGLREALRGQMRMERDLTATDEVIEGSRLKLNRAYDDFKVSYGFLNDPVNRRIFLGDTESALLQALEFDYEKAITAAKAEELGISPRPARAVKADILSRRVLFPPVEVANVETAKDALLHSLNLTGKVDMAFMMAAYGKDEEAIVAELDDLLYRDPVEGLVTADAYLSGDVKTKLAEARKFAEHDPLYAKNVVALEKVVPVDKLPSEIFASIGGAWVPADIYSAFAREISGAEVSFTHLSATGQWFSTKEDNGDFAKNNNEYGTNKLGATEILHQMMNSRGLEVKKRGIRKKLWVEGF